MTIKDDITAALDALNRPARPREILAQMHYPPGREEAVRVALCGMYTQGELKRPERGVYALPHVDLELADDPPEDDDEAPTPAAVKHPWRGYLFGKGRPLELADADDGAALMRIIPAVAEAGLHTTTAPHGGSVPAPSPLGSELDAAMARFEAHVTRVATPPIADLARKTGVLKWLMSLTQEAAVAAVLQAILEDLEGVAGPVEAAA